VELTPASGAYRLVVASDHAGLDLKAELVRLLPLLAPGWRVEDLGLPPGDPTDDYPDAARLVAARVSEGSAERGILVCGSGIGVSIAANKYPRVGAAALRDAGSAARGVLSEGLNVLCLAGRSLRPLEAAEIVAAFLTSEPITAPDYPAPGSSPARSVRDGRAARR
jgi:ribose 5-phosphate isomerase B